MKQLIAICALACVLGAGAPARAETSACSDVAARGHVNILTINILYSDFIGRMERLRAVADFADAQDAAGEPVDVILLQEVVSGTLAATPSLSWNLKHMLRRRGVDYNLRFRPVAGVPGLFMVGNAMLSRCEIDDFSSRLLPYAPERPLGGPGVPVLHEVQRIGIDIPGYGAAAVYNTHLCAYCPGSDRLRQTEAIQSFVEDHEDGAARLVVLGGDFNTDLNVPTDIPAYDLITGDMSFTDSYTAAKKCASCCSDAEGLAGCTYAVPGNTLAGGEPPVRIDYIFARGGFSTLDSEVVFNQPTWVSDHSGVLTRIGLQ